MCGRISLLENIFRAWATAGSCAAVVFPDRGDADSWHRPAEVFLAEELPAPQLVPKDVFGRLEEPSADRQMKFTDTISNSG